MSDFNKDMENLLNAYDSNWDDYLALRKQFIEKYSLSVDKLEERCDRYEKALTEISKTKVPFRNGCFHWEEFSEDALKAQKALEVIEGEKE